MGSNLHLTLVDQNAFGEPEGQAVSQLSIDLFRKIVAVPIFYLFFTGLRNDDNALPPGFDLKVCLVLDGFFPLQCSLIFHDIFL